jgi:hypothetical protein
VRLNCISPILGSVSYKDAIPPPLDLPKRQIRPGSYKRPPMSSQHFVPVVDV